MPQVIRLQTKQKARAKPTQAERVLDYIAEFGSITQLDALRDLGIMRLASRISDLKKQGYEINRKYECVKNRYGEDCYIMSYSIGGEAKQ